MAGHWGYYAFKPLHAPECFGTGRKSQPNLRPKEKPAGVNRRPCDDNPRMRGARLINFAISGENDSAHKSENNGARCRLHGLRASP